MKLVEITVFYAVIRSNEKLVKNVKNSVTFKEQKFAFYAF